ncbi:MAG: hypothetical protein ABI456_05220 [Ktedonobacteraceae bacterium]
MSLASCLSLLTLPLHLRLLKAQKLLLKLHNLLLQLLFLLLRAEQTQVFDLFIAVPEETTWHERGGLIELRARIAHFGSDLFQIQLQLLDLQFELLDLVLVRVLPSARAAGSSRGLPRRGLLTNAASDLEWGATA